MRLSKHRQCRWRMFAWMALVAILPVSGNVHAAKDAAAADLVHACIETADEELIGLDELELSCPGLEHALVELGSAAYLSAAELDQLTVQRLEDLVALREHYTKQPTEGAALATSLSSLPDILQQMQREQASTPPTWWDRVRNWIRERMQARPGEPPSWMHRWLDRLDIPEQWRSGLLTGISVLIVALALWIVFRELRAAGVLSGRRRLLTLTPDASQLPDQRASIEDLDRVESHERPAVLLRLLIDALTESRRVQAPAPLTTGELAARVRFDDDAQRDRFAAVARLAERAVFGGIQLGDADDEAVIAQGRALHAELRQPPVAAVSPS